MKSWGFNTIGNWSDPRIERNGQVAYVATVTVSGNHARVGSGSDYWGKMHDPFDPRFADNVQLSLQRVVSRVKGDPWCLGYFVDNELSWGGFGEENGRYGLGLGALNSQACPAPRSGRGGSLPPLAPCAKVSKRQDGITERQHDTCRRPGPRGKL